MSFNGKVALVTGGTSGIGRETAIQFAKQGAKVVVAGRRTEEGEAVVREIEAAGGEGRFVQTDVTKEDQVKHLVEETVRHYGRMDIAFNNAGIEQTAPITEFTEADYRKVFDINVLGVFLSQKYEIPAMLKSGGGSIINTSSIVGQIAMPGRNLYRIQARCRRYHQDDGTRTGWTRYSSKRRRSGGHRHRHDRPLCGRRGHGWSATACLTAPDGSAGQARGDRRRRAVFGV